MTNLGNNKLTAHNAYDVIAEAESGANFLAPSFSSSQVRAIALKFGVIVHPFTENLYKVVGSVNDLMYGAAQKMTQTDWTDNIDENSRMLLEMFSLWESEVFHLLLSTADLLPADLYAIAKHCQESLCPYSGSILDNFKLRALAGTDHDTVIRALWDENQYHPEYGLQVILWAQSRHPSSSMYQSLIDRAVKNWHRNPHVKLEMPKLEDR